MPQNTAPALAMPARPVGMVPPATPSPIKPIATLIGDHASSSSVGPIAGPKSTNLAAYGSVCGAGARPGLQKRLGTRALSRRSALFCTGSRFRVCAPSARQLQPVAVRWLQFGDTSVDWYRSGVEKMPDCRWSFVGAAIDKEQAQEERVVRSTARTEEKRRDCLDKPAWTARHSATPPVLGHLGARAVAAGDVGQ